MQRKATTIISKAHRANLEYEIDKLFFRKRHVKISVTIQQDAVSTLGMTLATFCLPFAFFCQNALRHFPAVLTVFLGHLSAKQNSKKNLVS